MRFAVDLLERFPSQRILVLGDVMLDRYIWGQVDRISPEAPVQVLRVMRETWTPGGAGNTARNVVALGGRAMVVGMVGEDDAGRRVRDSLQAEGIDFRGLSNGRQTTVKTRLLARNQQLLRLDREDTSPVSAGTEEGLLGVLREEAERFDVVIVSDYAKGVVTQRVMRFVTEHFRIVTVDPVPAHVDWYRDVTLLTPNHLEASAAAGIAEGSEDDLMRIGATLVQRTRSGVLVTRGEKGMTLFPVEGTPIHVPTDAQEVVDAVGAGDTVISAATLALSAGGELDQAVRFANLAAGIVVAKVGTATVAPDEIRARARLKEG
ncbi:MAG: bifunctional hydroxymethylpyrimidine kinase/phosphomethylpyrimidine kinase [Phycisphaerae bacterium]|nr:bifunctional hydroxymethylpyrimidine kinase/phosphomethylpyrimidine kinase [Phycisphaerae bacterium]